MSCPPPILDLCVTADTRAWGQPAVLLPTWAGSPCSHPPVETGKAAAQGPEWVLLPWAFQPTPPSEPATAEASYTLES